MFCTKHRVSIRRLYSVFCTSISVILSKFVVLSFSSKNAFLSFRAEPGGRSREICTSFRVNQTNNTARLANRSLHALLSRDDKGSCAWLGWQWGLVGMSDFSTSLEMTGGLVEMTKGACNQPPATRLPALLHRPAPADRFLDFARNDRRAWLG